MEQVLIILTLVGVGLLVGALAVYLIAIIVILRRIRHTAGLILFGVRAIAHRVEPVGEVVAEINGVLAPARDALVRVSGPIETGTPQAEGGPLVPAAQPGQDGDEDVG